VDSMQWKRTDHHGELLIIKHISSVLKFQRNWAVGRPGADDRVYYLNIGDTGGDVYGGDGKYIRLSEEEMEAVVRHYLKLKLEMVEERDGQQRNA
jgi:hypothetical protein